MTASTGLQDCLGTRPKIVNPARRILGLYWEKAAYEEAEHAAKFAELLGEVVTDSTKKKQRHDNIRIRKPQKALPASRPKSYLSD